jgi:hypothetical protein
MPHCCAFTLCTSCSPLQALLVVVLHKQCVGLCQHPAIDLHTKRMPISIHNTADQQNSFDCGVRSQTRPYEVVEECINEYLQHGSGQNLGAPVRLHSQGWVARGQHGGCSDTVVLIWGHKRRRFGPQPHEDGIYSVYDILRSMAIFEGHEANNKHGREPIAPNGPGRAHGTARMPMEGSRE